MSGNGQGELVLADVGDEDRIILLKTDDSELNLQIVKQSLLVKASKYFAGCLSFDSYTPEVIFDAKVVSFDALEMIAHFIELGEITPTFDNMEEIFRAADYLQMEPLLKMLYDHLVTEMEKLPRKSNQTARSTLRKFLRIHQIVRQFITRNDIKESSTSYRKTNQVSKYVLSIEMFLAVNFELINFEVEVLKFPLETIQKILSSDFLSITERDVLKTIKMWINYDLATRKQYFTKLLNCVRYNSDMNVEYVFDELYCDCRGTQARCLHSNDFCFVYMACYHSINKPFVFTIKKNARFRFN